MKKLTIALLFVSTIGFAQTKEKKEVSKTKIVEASCGQCQFLLESQSGCDLAVRIDGKAYFVDGSSMDEHGNPHSTDGMCISVRKAEVEGVIKDGRFQASYFKLLPSEGK